MDKHKTQTDRLHFTSSSVNEGHMPRLIECDFELWTDYLGDYVMMWRRNGSAFFADQKLKMRWLAFCPFLFGITDNLPMPWIRVFVNQDILHRQRLHEVDFTPAEMNTFEMADVIFQRCADMIVENSKDLKEILNFIYEIEERCSRQDHIDFNYALNKLVQLKVFPSIWNPLRRSYERKKKQAQLLILYFFKTIHHQIVHYGRDGQDKAVLVREAEANRVRIFKQFFPEELPYSEEAHKALKDGRLTEALELFTKAINHETLSSKDYCGRAETYIKMEKFMNALPDCWRSMILDHKNSSKSCFLASKCYYEMGNYDRAAEMNEQAMYFSSGADTKQKELIEAQSAYIERAITNKKLSRYRAVSESEIDPVEEEKTSVVFRKLQCEGSSLYQSKKYREAADKFHEALEMVASIGLKPLETQVEDVSLLHYCYGLACVHTGTYSNLQSAIEKFKHLIIQDFNIPASHYGLGLAYKNLNWFSEALGEFQQAMEKRKSCIRLQWPQTLVRLGETDPDILQKLLKNVIRECKHPPKPDAVCKFHSDAESSRTDIYQSDPDYKGFVRLLCNCRCCVEFHSGCWKMFRLGRGKNNDKEMLDKECPTPNCWGQIVHISIFKLDNDHPIEMTSSKKVEPKPVICKPAFKMKTTNALKLQKKAEKKQIRRDRREEDRKKEAEAQLVEESLASGACADTSHYRNIENDLQDLHASNQKYTVLMTKDQDDLSENKGKQKATKTKKKKEKTKQVLTFDLQFAADKDKELLGVNSLDCDDDFTNQPGLMGMAPPMVPHHHHHHVPIVPAVPSMMPTPAAVPPKPAALGNGLLPLPLKVQPVVDVFLQNLIECFVTVLQGGPQELTSSIVLDILSSVPSETRARVAAAGGIAAFLNSQPQFVVGGGKVGLAKGGPGLLSNGPTSPWGKMPNGGAGLMETPLAVSTPWKLGASVAQSNVNHTQKGLLGAFPQTPLSTSMNSETAGINMRSLNPSAQEFIPGPRNNSQDNNSSKTPNGEDDGKKEDADSGKDEDEDEDESGEFVMVTHKKHSHAKQLLKASASQRVPPYQNGIVQNMYNRLQEEHSIGENIPVASSSSATPHNVHQSVETLTPLSSAADKRTKNCAATIFPPPPPSSSSLSSATAAAAEKSLMPPPQPLPISSLLSAAARRRTVSDASSTVSEEVRACSPNSSGSFVSQGSSNSNPTSSTPAQGVTPLQPLKGAGLNLPKRAKRRNLLREKIVSLPNTQPNLASTSTTHQPFGVKLQGAMAELDDMDSIDSSSTSDRDGLESTSLASSVSLTSSLLGTKVEKAQTFKTDESDKDKKEWKPYSMGNNSSSPWGNSTTYVSSGNQSNQFADIYGGQASASSPPLQAAVGSHRRTESRVLRNLGLSSHSPSPPPTSDRTVKSAVGDHIKSFDIPSNNGDAHTGHMFDSSGNFRPALSGENLWHDAEIPTSSAKSSLLRDVSTSAESSKILSSQNMESKDPWAKPSNPTANRKFGLGDTLYGNKTSSSSSQDSLYFPSHHGRDPSSNFLSQLQGTTETAFKGASSRPESLLASPVLLSRAGVAQSDISTWSPLSSDSVQGESQNQAQSQTGFRAWTARLGQGQAGNHDLDENPFSLNLYRERSPAAQARANGVDAATAWASSLLQAQVPKPVATATASVNTDLTGEMLKTLQLRFMEVKRERDLLKLQSEQEHKERSLEMTNTLLLRSSLNEVKGQLETREKDLEKSRQQAEAAKRDMASLDQTLRETMVKVQQLGEVKGQLKREVAKGKGYEIQIVNLNIQAALTHIDERRKEGCDKAYHHGNIIHGMRNNQMKDNPNLVAKKEEWDEYVRTCETAFKEVLAMHKSCLQALEEGKSLEEILPIRAPTLPSPPGPIPPDNSLDRSKPKPQPVRESVPPEPEPAGAMARPDSPEDDETAFLKMISQGDAPAKPEKLNPAPAAEAPPPMPMRLPPGLPRRPLSQGPIPLNPGLMPNLPSRPTSAASSSSSSSNSSGLASIKLPSGRHVPRPSLASIAATVTSQSNPHQSQASSQQPKPLTIFERLVRTVQETFPDCSSRQIQQIIEALRRENGGSLSSFSYDALAKGIVNRIMDQREATSQPQANQLHSVESGSRPRGRKGHGNLRPGSPSEMTCTICHDDTEHDCGQEIRVLDCGHRFHEECIQSWLRLNQTCPNCRSHSLLEEDFPSLRKF